MLKIYGIMIKSALELLFNTEMNVQCTCTYIYFIGNVSSNLFSVQFYTIVQNCMVFEFI